MEPVGKKRRKGENYYRKEKQIIINVFNYFAKSMNVSTAVQEASKAVGCSERTMYAIKQEQQKGPVSSPKKSKKRKGAQENDRHTTYDENTQALIRRKVHDFFIRNVPPTLNTILASINNDDDLPNIKRTNLYRLLHDMGFVFQKVGRKSILIERDDIIRWRHKYLRDIRKFRQEDRTVVYTDESWVNVGHAVNKTDTTIQSTRQAFTQGLSTGLKSPSGLGPRFALVHAGGDHGFVPGAEYIFLCKKNTADAHNEMDAETYENWFSDKLLPNIPQNSVIVVDNAWEIWENASREKGHI